MTSLNNISIAHFVKEVNDRFARNRDIIEAIAENASDLAPKISNALFEVGVDLAEMIQSSFMSKENLKTADERFLRSTTPLAVDRTTPQISPEISGWSIATRGAHCPHCDGKESLIIYSNG